MYVLLLSSDLDLMLNSMNERENDEWYETSHAEISEHAKVINLQFGKYSVA